MKLYVGNFTNIKKSFYKQTSPTCIRIFIFTNIHFVTNITAASETTKKNEYFCTHSPCKIFKCIDFRWIDKGSHWNTIVLLGQIDISA